MKNQQTKRNQFINKELPITELMQSTGKSREQVLEELQLVQLKVNIEREPRQNRERIKDAKKEWKNNPTESIVKFFDHKLPSWGSIIFNSMRIKTL